MTPETRLLTADLRWTQVGKLAVGDELLAVEEEPPWPAHRRWRRSVVQDMTEVLTPCYQLTLDDGTRVVCPAQRRWLVEHNPARLWLRTSELKVGHRITRVASTWATATTREGGYLAAAFDGEGNLRQKPFSLRSTRNAAQATTFSLHFTQKNNEMLAEVRRCLDAFGFRYADKNHDVPRALWRLGITERAEVLRFLGQIRPLRLLAKFDPDGVGAAHTTQLVHVVAAHDIGLRSAIALQTSTRTCVAEGLLAHSGPERHGMGLFQDQLFPVDAA